MGNSFGAFGMLCICMSGCNHFTRSQLHHHLSPEDDATCSYIHRVLCCRCGSSSAHAMSESEDSDSDGAVHTETRAKQDDSCMQASKKRLSSDCCSKFNNAVVKLIGASICILGAVAICKYY